MRSADATNGAETKISMPGEWIDRQGRAQPKLLVRRLAVLKVDHIGDLLIAAPAFGLLRQFFPRAQIDLICGPWNVGLAKRLGVFDNVYGVAFFQPAGEMQSDPELARAARRAGVLELEKLQLGPYDLALDLRHDRESRSILTAIDARVYAGFGTTAEFPFLDVMLPMEDPGGEHGSASDLVLGPRQFSRGGPGTGESTAVGVGTGEISTVRDSISIDILVEGAKSPIECGTSTEDRRELGVALRRLVATPLRDGEPMPTGWTPLALKAPHRDLALISGWAHPEDWGVWALGALAQLQIALPRERGETHVQLDFELTGHVNQGNPQVECTIRGEGKDEPTLTMFTTARYEQRVSVVVPRSDELVTLVSEPFQLAPGEYQGGLRLYLPRPVMGEASLTVTLRDGDSGISLASRQIGSKQLRQGICDVPISCSIETLSDRLLFELRTDNGTAFENARIEMLTLRRTRRYKMTMPSAHTEKRLCMMVMRVALEFAQEPLFAGSSLVPQLTNPTSASTSADQAVAIARDLLEGWKRDGFCVVGIAMGAGKLLKKWMSHYFVELARLLLDLGTVKLVFLGGPAEKDEALEACHNLGLDPDAHVLCGAVPLAELGRVLTVLDLFVGNDSGLAHYAGRVGVRSIVIFSGATHPREWGPVGDNVSWIYRDEPCAPCYLAELKDCRYGHVCIRNLLPADVASVIVPELVAKLPRGVAGAPPMAQEELGV
jgi:ADP-heptose:LPS heptosyltransferase